MPYRNRHLLIVEDDAETRSNLRDILEIDGYQIKEAGQFSEAFERDDWDEIWGMILDRKLPDGTAEQWLSRFRSVSPDVSIIVVTGYHDLEGAIACLREGADDYILKPVNPDALRAALARLAQHRKSKEELQQMQERLRQSDRLAAIGTLAAGLGHDMNNVLLPVRARLEALDASQLPETVRSHLSAVRKSIAYLQQLSDGLHLLALNPDDADSAPATTNITQWWSQVGSLLRKAVPKRISFESDLPAKLPVIAVAPHRLTQAMLNLVVNAAEAIHDAGEVRVWATRESDIVRIGVKDTGEGMSAEVLEHALEPFYTTKKRGLGTGLGLSLVHGVVKAAGGSIEIDSQLGQGTNVTLIFPVAERSTRIINRDDSPAQRTVTITLHDKRLASFIGSTLTAAGFDVQASSDDSIATDVWVADATSEALQEARSFLRSDRRRRMIVVGDNHGLADDWMNLGVSVIDDPTDLQSIRRVIDSILEH